MNFNFVALTENQEAFFNILPVEWSNEILPIWEHYAPEAHIYVLKDKGQIVAGGIVALGLPADMKHFSQEVSEWVDKGYSYIGYLWVIEKRRNQHLGSLWLQELAKNDLKANYWLTIETEKLKHFYMSNGFRLVKKLEKSDHTEWLLVKDNPQN